MKFQYLQNTNNQINQNNSGEGDNVARDKNETNTYHNCVFVVGELTPNSNLQFDALPDLIKNENKAIFSSVAKPNLPLESYLIVTVEVDKHDDRQFYLNSWLIPDDSIKNEDQSPKEFINLLEGEEKEQGKICSLPEIPETLNDFLDRALEDLCNLKYNLTIEIFLPNNLMCEAIDRWQITDDNIL